VIAPSLDTARRFESRFRIRARIGTWEQAESASVPGVRPWDGVAKRRICVVGAIGMEKGFNVILRCARLIAAARLPLDFVIVGYSCDDDRLLATGCVHITGRYEEAEAIPLIKTQNADFAFLPALWPETWSYTLGLAWQAGLNVVAFDIGTPAERIKAQGGGVVVPLNIGERRLLQMFLSRTLFLGADRVNPRPGANAR
jgi:glycosyltransferase involved in cell wall biosynthesis